MKPRFSIFFATLCMLMILPLSCEKKTKTVSMEDALHMMRLQSHGSRYYALTIDSDWAWPDVNLQNNETLVFAPFVVYGKDTLELDLFTEGHKRQMFFPSNRYSAENYQEFENSLLQTLENPDIKNTNYAEPLNRFINYNNGFRHLIEFNALPHRPFIYLSPTVFLLPKIKLSNGQLKDADFVLQEGQAGEKNLTYTWSDEPLPADDEKCPNKTPEQCFWERVQNDYNRMCMSSTTTHVTPEYALACTKLGELLRKKKVKVECSIEGANGIAVKDTITMNGDYYLTDMCSYTTLLHEAGHVLFNDTHPAPDSERVDEINKRIAEIGRRMEEIDQEIANPGPNTDPDSLNDEKEQLRQEALRLIGELQQLRKFLLSWKIETECESYALVRENLAMVKELMGGDDTDNSGFPDWAEWAKDEVASITGAFNEWWDQNESMVAPLAKQKLCDCLTAVHDWIEDPANNKIKEACMEYGVYDTFNELRNKVCN